MYKTALDTYALEQTKLVSPEYSQIVHIQKTTRQKMRFCRMIGSKPLNSATLVTEAVCSTTVELRGFELFTLYNHISQSPHRIERSARRALGEQF